MDERTWAVFPWRFDILGGGEGDVSSLCGLKQSVHCDFMEFVYETLDDSATWSKFPTEESYHDPVPWLPTNHNILIIIPLSFIRVETKSLLFPEAHSWTSGSLSF